MPKRKGYVKHAGWFKGKKAKTIFDKSCYDDCYADFGDGLIVYDKDVMKLMKKHLRLRDRFNLMKIVMGTFYAFDILNGSMEEPEGKYYW